MSQDVYLIQYKGLGRSTEQYWMIAGSPEEAGKYVAALMCEYSTILVRRISVLPEEKKEEK